ncbi:hypothetical protein [Jannaschia aquimarina]|uniref:Alpha/beta hydrolase family protein n=1 Tax=Jannaschia aquimarina TaxID=935700 RepID=A0A0D1E9C4_9RHOB|nr:hypothetical protein [Jannaschia aquimarina]KIT14224.1 hypothetical protein jaqu_40180 [Jannaschia aquimarina]SNS48586.1 hypothetical protein SAMN05421775_101138 [Jannaschia aquimarina]
MSIASKLAIRSRRDILGHLRFIPLASDVDPRRAGRIVQLDAPDADNASCERHIVPDAAGTVVTFGGMQSGMGIPRREFAGTLRDRGRNLLFVKDFAQCWYQKGLAGLTTSRASTALFLAKQLSTLPRPWTFVGLSAGGYAAIHFGRALGADHVVAFSPQTSVDHEAWNRFASVSTVRNRFRLDDPENDLSAASEAPEVPVDLHFPAHNPYDAGQALRLQGQAGVTLRPHGHDDHNVPRQLRNAGRLHATILGGAQRNEAPALA